MQLGVLDQLRDGVEMGKDTAQISLEVSKPESMTWIKYNPSGPVLICSLALPPAVGCITHYYASPLQKNYVECEEQEWVEEEFQDFLGVFISRTIPSMEKQPIQVSPKSRCHSYSGLQGSPSLGDGLQTRMSEERLGSYLGLGW